MANKNNNKYEYAVRIPVKMLQITEPDGFVRPVAFYWENKDGSIKKVKIDRCVNITPEAEIISGTVGERFECEIMGKREYLYYGRLNPRKWFAVVSVTEDEYNAYYKLP